VRRIEHTSAYLLHQQPWGESGRIYELIARDHGRMSVFAQGVRGAKARLAGVLQPFVPLLVSWAGRGEAPRLTGAERDAVGRPPCALPKERLLSAYYMSELLLTLTVRHDPQPALFDCYATALSGLYTGPSQDRELRLFEKRFLDVIGYGLPGVDEQAFDDPEELQRLRPLLREAVNRCLEGRRLKTRVVAKSLMQLGKMQ
jgi:DNA repair protein RecO (recombination protein O)